MEHPEYLDIFHENGSYKLQAIFKDFDGNIAEKAMEAIEIKKLIDPNTGLFIEKMQFDDWLFEIYKYEIDPINKIIKIRARKPR